MSGRSSRRPIRSALLATPCRPRNPLGLHDDRGRRKEIASALEHLEIAGAHPGELVAVAVDLLLCGRTLQGQHPATLVNEGKRPLRELGQGSDSTRGDDVGAARFLQHARLLCSAADDEHAYRLVGHGAAG